MYWQKLSRLDFEHRPGRVSSFVAKVQKGSDPITLKVVDCKFLDDKIIDLFHEMLDFWENKLQVIYSVIKDALRRLVTSRDVVASDLVLLLADVRFDDDDRDDPSCCSFFLRVSGSYKEYDEFKDDSRIDVIFDINNWIIDWSSGDLHISFDVGGKN